MALLGDNRAHVFVAGADLDLVDPTGRECMLSQGDVVQVVGIPPARRFRQTPSCSPVRAEPSVQRQ